MAGGMHAIASSFLTVALIGAIVGLMSTDLIAAPEPNRHGFISTGELLRAPRQAGYAKFATDERNLLALMTADDPPTRGGLEPDATVGIAESAVGNLSATLDQDFVRITVLASHSTSADALNVVEASLNVENVLYVRLQEVDGQLPSAAPDLAAQQNEFIGALVVDAVYLNCFAIDAEHDVGAS